MMVDKCNYGGGKVLLVEGKDDCTAILALRSSWALSEPFEIVPCESDKKALSSFNAHLAMPIDQRPATLGLVLDADCTPGEGGGGQTAVDRRWQQIGERLRRYGYEMPGRPDRGGTILPGPAGHPRIGLWVMPDNATDGALEDFLVGLARSESVTFARKCAEDARRLGAASFRSQHLNKATVRTYLAWQDKPGSSLEVGFSCGAFDPRQPAALPLVDWLRELFQAGKVNATSVGAP